MDKSCPNKEGQEEEPKLNLVAAGERGGEGLCNYSRVLQRAKHRLSGGAEQSVYPRIGSQTVMTKSTET